MKKTLFISCILILTSSFTSLFAQCAHTETGAGGQKIFEATRVCDPTKIGHWQVRTNVIGSAWADLLPSQVEAPGQVSGNQSVLSQLIKPVLPMGTYRFKIVYPDGSPTGTQCESDEVVFVISTVLALDITSLHATTVNNGVKLTWTMDRDDDVEYYSIQRSLDGRSFLQIAMFVGQDKTSNVSYSYTDNPGAKVIYYRIVVIGKNGSQKVSSTVTVRISSSDKSKLSISPNPVTSSSVIMWNNALLPKDAKLNLYDMTGKLTQYVNAESLPSGAYILQVVLKTGETDQIKIVKQ